MPRHLAGDPAALRAAATQLRQNSLTARDAAEQVRSSHARTAGNWQGQAAGAFGAAAASTGARVEALATLADAATPLETYADVLEQAQAVWDANYDTAVHGYGSSAYTPAVLAMGEAQRLARAANERAAEEIARIASAATDAMATEQVLRTQTSMMVGNGLSAAGAAQKAAAAAAAAAFDPGAQAAADGRYTALTRLGTGLAVVGPAAGQLLADADNPYYSTAERAGRAAGQGASVGMGALGGAALGTLLFPGVGTVTGFAIGAVAGLAGATVVDEYNADFVDWSGEQADALASW